MIDRVDFRAETPASVMMQEFLFCVQINKTQKAASGLKRLLAFYCGPDRSIPSELLSAPKSLVPPACSFHARQDPYLNAYPESPCTPYPYDSGKIPCDTADDSSVRFVCVVGA
jgi:hypothetical protein